LVGYHAPGFINVHADPIAISRELGAQLQHFSLTELRALMDGCQAEQVEADVLEVIKMDLPFEEGLGRDDLTVNSRCHLAMKQLFEEQHLDALALRCWPELPNHYGHWPYLAMMRLGEQAYPVALEGDVDGAVLGLVGKCLGIGVGYISDWLEHDANSITLWHPGHAPREICSAAALRLSRHFNDDRPLVVNGQLASDREITLARLWRCDGRYHLTAFAARTARPRRPLLGAHGLALVDGSPVPDRFDRLCQAGMPHHVTVFSGNQVDVLRRFARLICIQWFDAGA
jgi:L-fucose isomerase-like protein